MNEHFRPNRATRTVFDPRSDGDSCGVGFITHKRGIQTLDLLIKTHEALCAVPHRGAMSAEGIGDGAGVNIDLSIKFFRTITGQAALQPGEFGVANFFYPHDPDNAARATALIEEQLGAFDLPVILWRDVPVNHEVLRPAGGEDAQLPIKQLVFWRPGALREATRDAFERYVQDALSAIEAACYSNPEPAGFYPCSMSSRTLLYKGRLNSFELIPYFPDLRDRDHEVSTSFVPAVFSPNQLPNRTQNISLLTSNFSYDMSASLC